MIQENVHHTLIYLLHSPDTGTPEAYRLNTSIVESACAILAIFTLAHPSPPFSSDSLHFTSRFLYTVFSQRTCGLSTGLALLLTASYLSLATLHAEVQAYIVAEMAHGLFHADISFAEYEALTHGVWRVGGCTCPQCASRVPRILRFALRPDVGDLILQRGARRALVGLFGPGWCTPEFATLPVELQVAALKGLAKRTTPRNALAILWAAEAARTQLAAASTADSWAEIVRPLVDAGRAQVDAVLGGQTAAVFAEADWGALVRADAEADWVAIMREDSERFEDGERVECVMRSVVRGMNEMNVGRVYQALMDLLPDTDPFQPEQLYTAQPLSQASHVRVQAARMDVLTWLKRGGRVRAERVARKGGFDGVNSRALREIGNCASSSQTADPQPDALLAPPSTPPSQRLAPVQPVLNAAKALLPPPLPARGATLEIGIPCIILWKRERLKAVARYIGEVEGEAGPWVGLEVPASAVDGDGQWHDGSWGGIRYFELDGVWSDREHARGTRGGRSPRREEKRVRGVSPDVEGSRDSRGLFVRPSVVLYVVDAVADS
ncbi:hypothetical protein DFH09DRAFT_914918 [Mycena vulgaris]|nr:hypothetical protein DFH09DRAFT_914918 [Mycena vulgaris]